MLVVSVFGVAITIGHGDRDSVRHVAYLGGYCATKLPLAVVLIARRLPQALLRQPMGGVLTRDDHALFRMGSGATAMVHAHVRPL